jgi:hypothetical protein
MNLNLESMNIHDRKYAYKLMNRIIALPMVARKRLLVEGPGWLLQEGRIWPSASLRDSPPRNLEDDQAWLPCDSAAVLEAAAPKCGRWFNSSEGATIFRSYSNDSNVWARLCPIECALSALEELYGAVVESLGGAS